MFVRARGGFRRGWPGAAQHTGQSHLDGFAGRVERVGRQGRGTGVGGAGSLRCRAGCPADLRSGPAVLGGGRRGQSGGAGAAGRRRGACLSDERSDAVPAQRAGRARRPAAVVRRRAWRVPFGVPADRGVRRIRGHHGRRLRGAAAGHRSRRPGDANGAVRCCAAGRLVARAGPRRPHDRPTWGRALARRGPVVRELPAHHDLPARGVPGDHRTGRPARRAPDGAARVRGDRK